MGFAVTQMLATFVELRLPDAFDRQPLDAAEVAGRVGADPATVKRLLRALALYDVVKMDKRGRFKLTRTGKTLRSNADNSMADWVRYLNEPSTRDAWAGLTESVRTGSPAFPSVHGKSVWGWFADHPAEGEQFGSAMQSLTQIDIPGIVNGYPWPESGTICDIGGGVGTVLAAVLSARPQLRGILVDHQDVLAAAESHLTEAGVGHRVSYEVGDIFEGISAEADIYMLKDVLHDWDDGSCAQILSSVRSAAPYGATLVLIEQLQPENAAVFPTSLVDLHMLTQADGGRQRSEDELHGLLKAAGFCPGKTFAGLASSMVSATAV